MSTPLTSLRPRGLAVVTAVLLAPLMSCRGPTAGERAARGPVEMTRTVSFSQPLVFNTPGFDETKILNDGPMVPSPISGPTKMAIAPDGRIFIAEHWGGVRIVKKAPGAMDEAVVPTAFLRIPGPNIDTTGSRGLMGIALDPSFAANGYVYLHYTRKVSASVSRNRVSRFKASAANPDLAEVDGNGAPIETLLFEMTQQGPANAHNSMPMVFGADGMLWVATGDNNVGANARNTNHTGGKILRMTSTGAPAPGNPLISSSNEIEKRLWAKGLRNPWTLSRDPTTNRIFFNDVGSTEGSTPDMGRQPWEEANFVPLTTTTLLDYGWPDSEGVGPNIVYRYRNGPGDDGADCAIVGGAFYRSSGQPHSFPASYNGAFFFGDHCSGYINYLSSSNQTPVSSGAPGNTASPFATNLGAALLDLQMHPDGSLYYIARASVARDHDAPGIIGRVRPTTTEMPAVAISDPKDGDPFPAPADITVTVTATSATAAITKVELFSNDVKVGEDTAAPYQFVLGGLAEDEYRLTARASNSAGGVKTSDAVTVVVGGPTARITTPGADGTPYIAGMPVSFSGSAMDAQDGTLPASAFEWNVMLHHNSHTHPAAGPIAGVTSGSFTPNPDDETDHDVHYVIYLTVTDSAGLRHTAKRVLDPIKSNFTMATSPAVTGMKLYLDGSPQNAPNTFIGVGGANRTLEAPLCQTLPVGAAAPTFYGFGSWSDGGDAAHGISTPTSARTYTASYVTGPWVTADIGAVGVVGNYAAFGTSTAQNPGCSFTLKGSGVDVWGTADEFRFVSQPLTGDGSISARVVSLTATDAFAKAGVMMRDGTAANARNLFMLITPTASQGFRFQRRLTAGGTTTREFTTTASFPGWVKIERSNGVFRGYWSPTGASNSWSKVGADVPLALGTTLQVGLAVTNHNDGALATAVFDNVVVVGPTPPTPPNAPSNLTASGGVNQVRLDWTDNASNETGFEIDRKLQSQMDDGYLPVGTAPVNAVSFIDTPVAAGSYTYRVRATNAAGDSGNSNPANAVVVDPTPTVPASPTALVASDGVNQASLMWSDNSNNETGFKIERKPAADPVGSFTLVFTTAANVTSYVDSPLAVGSYSYRVRATNAVGDSPQYSNVDDATVTAPPVGGPAPPSNCTAVVANGGNVTVSWTDNANNETGFRVEKKTGTGGYVAITPNKAANVTSHVETVAAGTYAYRVVALGSPNSAASNEAVVVIGGAAADAYVRSGTSAGTNFGTNVYLEVKQTSTTTTKRNSFLRFSLAGVGTTVTSAKLRLFGRAQTTAKATSVYSVDDTTWGETTVTWNTPTTDAGGPVMSPSPLATVTVAGLTTAVSETVGAWYEWDVTSYIQQRRAAGESLVSLGIKSGVPSDEGQTSFTSRNSTTANKPLLIITSKN